MRKLARPCLPALAIALLGGCGDSNPTAVPPVDNVLDFRQSYNGYPPRSGRYAGVDPVAMRFTWVESDSVIPTNPTSAGDASQFWRGSLTLTRTSDSSRTYTGLVDTTLSMDGWIGDTRGYTVTRTFRVEVVDSAGSAVRARIYAELAYDWKGSGGASTSTPTLPRSVD